MSEAADDPRCPECGGPIGQTAAYCMHCSADLTEERAAADADGDGVWDRAEGPSAGRQGRGEGPRERSPDVGGTDRGTDGGFVERLGVSPDAIGGGGEPVLAADGLVDDTLTVAVDIVGGLVVGAVGTLVLAAVTGSGWALAFGVVAWLGATAYLVRRRTVQGAVAKTGYAVAVVLLSVPVIALSPVVTVDGGVGERGGLFLVLLFFVAVPAGVAAAVGWVASRFVPGDASGSDG